ncbi:GDSL esterase/lipase At5g55050-like [Bidens hawaiensis]|uniref:GDSL esterase/lipase At5g55050-like n=1 Tax=Bidens hawaiensis TaxID=980011 RepID=UPI00404A47CB
MANSNKEVPLNLITSLFFYSFLLLLPSLLSQSVPAANIFGDSLVDVGNNNFLSNSLIKANFPHNGIDFPNGEATGRFSNGKNPADFLAEKVGLPSAQPYLVLMSKNEIPTNGVNFASGGAGIFNETGDVFKQVVPLSKQVKYFTLVHEPLVHQLGTDGVRNHLAKSLFMIVIGSNDLLAYFNNDSKASKKYTPQQYVDLMGSTLIQYMKRLYSMGARKFMVTGVGMIGCSPEQRKHSATGECKDEANYWSKKYNNGLTVLLQNLKSELSDINYSYFDTYGAMNNVIQNPQAHGINNIKDACCGGGKMKADLPCIPSATYCSNRSDHLFWDRFHPTEAISSLISDLFYKGPKKFAFPINVEQLIKL